MRLNNSASAPRFAAWAPSNDAARSHHASCSREGSPVSQPRSWRIPATSALVKGLTVEEVVGVCSGGITKLYRKLAGRVSPAALRAARALPRHERQWLHRV